MRIFKQKMFRSILVISLSVLALLIGVGALLIVAPQSQPVNAQADSKPVVFQSPCAVGSDFCDFENKYINPAIDFLSIGFGLLVIIMIASAGIQYSAAGGDPQKVNNAKKRISNAVLALLLFIFMFALLQWLVPGGLF